MGCGLGCLKCILITINIIFAVIGVTLMSIGIFLMVGAAKYLEPALDATFNKILQIGSNVGVANYDDTGTMDLEQLGQVLSPIAICLIVFGVFLIVMCVLGLVGVCKKVEVVLYVYAAIVLALFITQLILVILFFTGVLDDIIEEKVVDKIQSDYVKTDAFDITSLTVNLMQTKLQCCGFADYTDFTEPKGKKKKEKKNPKWEDNRKRKLNNAGSPPAGQTKHTLDTPLSCCMADTTSGTCAVGSLSANDNNYKVSCFKEVKTTLHSFRNITIGVISAILIIQALCAIAAIVIAVYLKKEEMLV